MKKFNFKIVEEYHENITIEAETEEEAAYMAQLAYYDGDLEIREFMNYRLELWDNDYKNMIEEK